MPPKRPHVNPFGDDEHGGNGSAAPSSPSQIKKMRLDAQQQQPPPPKSTPGIPSSAAVQAQLAAAKAKIDAQVAALRAKNQLGGGGSASSSSTPPPPSLPASAPKVGSSALPPGKFDIAAIKRQVEEGQRKHREQQQRQQQQQQQRAPPPSSSASTSASSSTSRPTGIHPLLMQSGAGPSSSSSASRTNRNAAATAEAVNPYLAAAQEDEGEQGAAAGRPAGGRSMHRTLRFNRQGRHIQAAEEARKEAELEALKRRIQESAKRAGMQEGLTGEERRIKRQPPPDVEWWDAALLPSGNYDCVPDDPASSSSNTGDVEPLITGQGTPIDVYIQHPIPIPAPNDKFKVEPKGVMLTKKEMKKMRKQRRAAELQDKQDRIKMGLQPPDPPKVKLSNLMRVLTSEAVADPTKVEARVRREVAARQEQHERDNLERQLTSDQRREKTATKMEKDEAKGIYVTVYKIKHLVSGGHKFKVRKNAHQNGLTGLCLFHPDFALVVVEGPSKGIKAYKRLMTIRIDWTDPGRAREIHQEEEDDDPFHLNRDSGISARHLAPMGEIQQPTQFEKDSSNAALVDWTTNSCQVIFEGPQRERCFPTGFKARNAATDLDAREILGGKWSGFWDVAKRHEEAARE